MAADVGSLVRILNGYKDDSGGAKSTVLMTRDLLGGGGDQSQELDLDLQVPTGWEKHLDLKSGKVYLQRCNITSSSSSFSHINHSNPTVSNFQDLNFPPSSSSSSIKPLLNVFDDPNLELKLVSPSSLSSSPPPPSLSLLPSPSTLSFQSVCTLDKVKSALERAEKDQITIKKRPSSSSSYSSSSPSMIKEEEIEEKFTISSPVAAGCPGCLSYVLVMNNNPKCPRCNSFVPLSSMKKPKIDLNISI